MRFSFCPRPECDEFSENWIIVRNHRFFWIFRLANPIGETSDFPPTWAIKSLPKHIGIPPKLAQPVPYGLSFTGGPHRMLIHPDFLPRTRCCHSWAFRSVPTVRLMKFYPIQSGRCVEFCRVIPILFPLHSVVSLLALIGIRYIFCSIYAAQLKRLRIAQMNFLPSTKVIGLEKKSEVEIWR